MFLVLQSVLMMGLAEVDMEFPYTALCVLIPRLECLQDENI